MTCWVLVVEGWTCNFAARLMCLIPIFSTGDLTARPPPTWFISQTPHCRAMMMSFSPPSDKLLSGLTWTKGGVKCRYIAFLSISALFASALNTKKLKENKLKTVILTDLTKNVTWVHCTYKEGKSNISVRLRGRWYSNWALKPCWLNMVEGCCRS